MRERGQGIIGAERSASSSMAWVCHKCLCWALASSAAVGPRSTRSRSTEAISRSHVDHALVLHLRGHVEHAVVLVADSNERADVVAEALLSQMRS